MRVTCRHMCSEDSEETKVEAAGGEDFQVGHEGQPERAKRDTGWGWSLVLLLARLPLGKLGFGGSLKFCTFSNYV